MFLLFFIIGGTLALSGVVMLLWNWLMPLIFNLRALTYWQSMGLLLLIRILFGGFHFKRPENRRPPFANPAFREKFMNMTDEEKQQFKEQWKQRCGK